MPLVRAIRILAFDDQTRFGTSIRNEPVEYYADINVIKEQSKGDKLIILLTTATDETILEKFQNLPSVQSILILAVKPVDVVPTKVIGVYPQLEPLLLEFHEAFNQLELQLNLSSFLPHQQKDGTDHLPFYFYPIWRQITKDQPCSKKDLIDYCRTTYPQLKPHIDDYEKSYKAPDVLQWLDRSRHPFPFHLLLSDALRTQDEPMLSLGRPFLQDLMKQMKPSTGGPSSNQVYLGAQLPSDLIHRFEEYQIHDSIAFQCFLPVTRSRAEALLEVSRPCRRTDMANVLFKIELNATPCAAQGDKLWIDVGTPFHVSCVTRSSGGKENNQLLTVIKLMAVDKLTRERMFESFLNRQKALGRTVEDLFTILCSKIRLVKLLVDLIDHRSFDSSPEEAFADELIGRGQYAEAAKVLSGIADPPVRVLNKLGCLQREHLYDYPKALVNHQQALTQAANAHEKAETLLCLGFVHHAMKEFHEAFRHHADALKIFEHEKKRDLGAMARAIVGMGNAKYALGDLDEALQYAERALAMREHEIKPRNNLDVASCLGNIGNILYKQGDLERALSFAKRAVDLLTECAPNDPRLAAALNNVAGMYEAMGEFSKARENFQKALQTLKDDEHPYRKLTLNNLAALDAMENQRT